MAELCHNSESLANVSICAILWQISNERRLSICFMFNLIYQYISGTHLTLYSIILGNTGSIWKNSYSNTQVTEIQAPLLPIINYFCNFFSSTNAFSRLICSNLQCSCYCMWFGHQMYFPPTVIGPRTKNINDERQGQVSIYLSIYLKVGLHSCLSLLAHELVLLGFAPSCPIVSPSVCCTPAVPQGEEKKNKNQTTLIEYIILHYNHTSLSIYRTYNNPSCIIFCYITRFW